ncbi:heteromeric transposase endonuclease subunit TnsA [Shigella sonnei]|nr:heteromeric transposase endonuclease subunit TnsA [Shigella sonnei]
MAKANSSFSEVQIARRIKEGRGQGHGKDYIPWLTVQEVPSSGRSHRIYSHKTGRVHHLLSDLELAVFLSLEWESSVLDIREQFPLLPSDTRKIAIDSGIKHPVIRGVDQVMSTDFLVDCKDGPFEQFAIQVKPAAALQDERTLEKLELERRYWQQKQIPWFIFTDKEINPVVKENIEWLYSVKTEEVSAELLAQLSPLAHILQEKGDENIINVCKQVDIAYDLELGKTLSEIRALTANGFIKFNIYKSFRANKCADLCISQVVNMEELRYVAN